MPERLDLAHQLPLLEAAFTGCRLAGLRATDPVVQRVLLPAPPSTVLPGRVLTAVRRHGHFLRFVWDGVPPVETAVHLMLSGRFSIVGVEARCPKDAASAFDFEGGRALLLRDATQMAKVIHLASEQAATVPGLGPVGVNVLGPDFTVAALAALLRRGDQRGPSSSTRPPSTASATRTPMKPSGPPGCTPRPGAAASAPRRSSGCTPRWSPPCRRPPPRSPHAALPSTRRCGTSCTSATGKGSPARGAGRRCGWPG